ncbi:MAG: helix-turn-helix domain-containing protein [Acetobacteraceae bacterium]|jgi:AraC-like DNA-binding protein
MRLQITTEDVPERSRFEAWHDAVYRTLAISAQPLPDADGPFRARFCARTSGPLVHCSFDADRYRAIRQGRDIAHRHWDSYWIGREFSAGAFHTIGGQDWISNPGDLVVGDADAVSDSRPADRYSHQLWLVPKALLDPHLPALRRPIYTRLSDRNGVDALAGSYLDALTRNWDSISEVTMGSVADTLARLIGIACGAVAAEQSDAVRAGRLVEAKRYIDRHLADPDLLPASVAASLGISVRTLHALFEPTGTSFARYVLRRRLEECRTALLGNPRRAVTDIAFAWGFSSLSGFYRAFHAAFGMSPGDLRAMSQPDTTPVRM